MSLGAGIIIVVVIIGVAIFGWKFLQNWSR